MKNTTDKKYILFNVALIIYSLVYILFIVSKYLKYTPYINAAFILIITFLAYFVFGYREDRRNSLKKNIFYKTTFLVIVFFQVIYGLGLIIGFKKNAYSLKPIMILQNIICPMITYLCIEVYRYILINNKKKYNILLTVALTIFEIVITVRIPSTFTLSVIYVLITSSILPILSKNFVLTKLTKEGGLKPVLVYRLLMDMYIYLVPIVPGFNDYLNSIIGIFFPLLLYIIIYDDIEEWYRVPEKRDFRNKFSKLDATIIGLTAVFVCLISGFFPFSLIGVASSSMQPYVDRGDAVLYHTVRSNKDLNEGDIIVFQLPDKDKVIIHRIVEITNEGEEVRYITKGDANNANDSTILKLEDIKGKVKFKIKYIAFPSVILSDLFKEGDSKNEE